MTKIRLRLFCAISIQSRILRHTRIILKQNKDWIALNNPIACHLLETQAEIQHWDSLQKPDRIRPARLLWETPSRNRRFADQTPEQTPLQEKDCGQASKSGKSLSDQVRRFWRNGKQRSWFKWGGRLSYNREGSLPEDQSASLWQVSRGNLQPNRCAYYTQNMK